MDQRDRVEWVYDHVYLSTGRMQQSTGTPGHSGPWGGQYWYHCTVRHYLACFSYLETVYVLGDSNASVREKIVT